MQPEASGHFGASQKGQTPKLSCWILGLVLALAACWTLLQQLGQRDLLASHEARAALNAKWFLDHWGPGPSSLPDGTLEAQKPPAYYWAVACYAHLAGQITPDAWSVRLPAACAGLGMLLALSLACWLSGHAAEGLLAAGFLLGMAAFVWVSRLARTDIPLAFAITCGLLAWELAREVMGPRRWAWFALASVGFMVGWLVKGPMAVVLPAAVLLTRCCLEWNNPGGRRWLLGCAATLVAGSALAWPWFWQADKLTQGAFGTEFFGLHHVGRGMGGSRLRSHPAWFYLAQLPVSALPASLLLPFAAFLAWRYPPRGQTTRGWWQLGLAWTMGGVGLLSLARFKRADYLMPVLPGLALLLAFSMAEGRERLWACLNKPRRRLVLANCGLALVLVPMGWQIHGNRALPTGEETQYRDLASNITEKISPQDHLVFFQVEDHLLAYHLNRPFTTRVMWASLLEDASRPGGVVVVTETARLLEGYFVHPDMRVEDLADGGLDGPCNNLACVRLRLSRGLVNWQEVTHAPVPPVAHLGADRFFPGGVPSP